jgi:predicted PurR-regulated permease PerM
VTRSNRSSGLRVAAIVASVIAALYLAREVLIPLAFAITLSLVLSPAVGWLQNVHLKRFPAVLVVMIVSITIAGGISYVIFDQLVQVANELPSYRDNIHNKLTALRTPNKGALGRAAESVKQLGKELTTPTPEPPEASPPRGRGERTNSPANPLPVQVVEPPANGLVYVRDLTQPFLGPLAVLGIVLVFTVFLLVEEVDLRNRLFRLAGLNRLNVVTQALDDATHRVSRYLMLQFLVNAGFGLFSGTGLYLIGVPYAALWGTVAALFRIVPYIGSVIAGLLPLVLSLAVFDGWKAPLLVFLLFTVLEVITANLLEPRLYGSHTGISSLALLLTTVFWATLWGPAGLILSTPLTVCLVVLGRHVPHLFFLHILLGDEPALAAEAHLYQRLLAMDDQEARAVAEEYLRENSLLQLYDSVILPTLTLSEQDRHKGDLDPEREEFVFLSLREMLAEFSEKTQNAAGESPEDHPEQTNPGRILCFPAHDEADEIAAAMLAQLLEQAGCATISFPLGSSSENMLGIVEPSDNDIFCISAVPPFAFSHARNLNRQLRTKFPHSKVLIGVWGFSGDIERAVQRFKPWPPEKFVVSLADAIAYLHAPAPALYPEVPNPEVAEGTALVQP